MSAEYGIAALFAFLGGVLIHSLLLNLPLSLPLALFFLSVSLPLLLSRVRVLRIGGVVLIALLLGFLRFDLSLREHERIQLALEPILQQESELVIRGRVTERPRKLSYGRISFPLELESVSFAKEEQPFSLPENASFLVELRDAEDRIRYGQELSLRGRVKEVENFQTENGRIFDYVHYLEKHAIFAKFSAREYEITREANPWNPLVILSRLKDTLLQRISRFLPEPESALLKGILLGEKTALPDWLEEAFRRTGLMHIVVLSGYNVSIVIIAIMSLLAWMRPRTRALFILLSVVAFVILVGAGPTVVRAALMASFLVFARVLGKLHYAERALLFAAFLMVLVNPWILRYDISFQLSVLATYGIMRYMPKLEAVLHRVPSFLAFRESLSATLAAQLMVAPLILYYMGTFSVVAPVVNMLVLFIIPPAMLFGFLLITLGPILPGAAPILTPISYLSLAYVIFVVDTFSRFRFAEIRVPPFSFLWVLLYYGALFMLTFVLERRTESSLRREQYTELK